MSIRLDNIFILPAFVGKGFGQVLMKDFLTRVKIPNLEKSLLKRNPMLNVFMRNLDLLLLIESSIKNRY